jgi:alpha-mannosidase
VVGSDSALSAVEGLTVSDCLLENDLLRLTFNEDGTIGSIIDKTNGKEIVSGGVANRLSVYSDPGDAWDFSISYDTRPSDCFLLEEVNAWIEGPHAIVCRKYHYKDSHLTQKVRVTAGSRRIDFITEVDWNESEKMLRTSFPVTVSANEATCDIQFGNIKRPTHRNTSWDMAKYEICAHKWVDLSQSDYGVALMNDCKYGYKVGENCIDLDLLRSPHYPDPVADQGHHEFTYALYPHTGNFIEGGVVRAGYDLNVPLRTVELSEKTPSDLSGRASFLGVNSENVVIETVKKAEDSDGMIVRLYECHGSETKATLRFNFDYQFACMVDLMENPIKTDKFDSDTLELKFSPYEIHTILISFS